MLRGGANFIRTFRTLLTTSCPSALFHGCALLYISGLCFNLAWRLQCHGLWPYSKTVKNCSLLSCTGKWRSDSQGNAKGALGNMRYYSNPGECNLFISLICTYPACTQGIVCSKEVGSKPKQSYPQSHILIILSIFWRFFSSSSFQGQSRPLLLSSLLMRWKQHFSLSKKWVMQVVELEDPVSVNPSSYAELFRLWFFNRANSIEYFIMVGMRSKAVSFIRCSWKKWGVLVKYVFSPFCSI